MTEEDWIVAFVQHFIEEFEGQMDEKSARACAEASADTQAEEHGPEPACWGSPVEAARDEATEWKNASEDE